MKDSDSIGFDFQAISVKQARQMLGRGDSYEPRGRYAPLINGIRERIKAASRSDAIVFGLPIAKGGARKELPIKIARQIVSELNKAFKRLDIDWRATYPSDAKLVVVMRISQFSKNHWIFRTERRQQNAKKLSSDEKLPDGLTSPRENRADTGKTRGREMGIKTEMGLGAQEAPANRRGRPRILR